MLAQTSPTADLIPLVQGQSGTYEIAVYDSDGVIVDATVVPVTDPLIAKLSITDKVGKEVLMSLDSTAVDPDGIILGDGTEGWTVRLVFDADTTAGIFSNSLKNEGWALLIGDLFIGNTEVGVLYTKRVEFEFRQSIVPLPFLTE